MRASLIFPSAKTKEKIRDAIRDAVREAVRATPRTASSAPVRATF